MSIQRLKIWHWWLIAISVGAAFAFIWTGDFEDLDAGTLSDARFLRNIDRRTGDGRLIYQDIVIEPMRAAAGGEHVQRVRFDELRRNVNTDQWDPIPGSTIVKVPVMKIAPRQNYRVADFLADRKKELPTLDYGYAWWKVSQLDDAAADPELHWWQHPKAAWGVAILGSILLIGIVWPLVIRLLVKLGLGDPEEATGVDLSKVQTASAAAAAPVGVSDAERRRLDDLNAELESNVGSMMIDADERDEEEERRHEEAVVRKLEAHRLEAQDTDKKSDEPKEYGGEFYPVARVGGKAKD